MQDNDISDESLLCLSLGSGAYIIPNFKLVDINPEVNPDYVMDITDLQFEPKTVDVIYASHVLEHLRPANSNEMLSKWDYFIKILTHWRQVLKTGGILMIAVPDIKALSELIIEYSHVDLQKTFIDAIFGGWRNDFDFHFSGFTQETLTSLLEHAGFSNIERFDSFCGDESSHRIMGKQVSLNLKATVKEVSISEVDYKNYLRQLRDFIKNLTKKEVMNEVEILRSIADDRLRLIHKLMRKNKKLKQRLSK